MKNILFATVVLFVTMPAHALMGGDVDANLASSPWAGVGAVSVNGATFSGALIGSQYVLTAAHVVGGQESTPGNVHFTLNVKGNIKGDAGSNIGGAASHVVATKIIVFPGFKGTTPGKDGVWHDDLALIKLATPVSSDVPVYGLYDGGLNGKILTLVGYGSGEDAKSGVISPASPNVKRAGQNRVDKVLMDDDGGTHDEIFIFDFDGLNAASNIFGPPIPLNLTLGATIEAQFAGGDSGGPVFVNDNGVWKIAGIAAFNGNVTALPGSNIKFGGIGGGTVIAAYLPWIDSTLASMAAPVPEPHAWLMLLIGLGLVRGVARRSRLQGS